MIERLNVYIRMLEDERAIVHEAIEERVKKDNSIDTDLMSNIRVRALYNDVISDLKKIVREEKERYEKQRLD